MKPIDRLGLGPSYHIEEKPNGTKEVFVKPPEFFIPNAEEKSVTLTSEQYQRFLQWRNTRVLIQDALPDLTPCQREVLMTGL